MVINKMTTQKFESIVENKKTEKNAHQSNLGNQNLMRKIKIEKIVLSVGGLAENLEKGVKLLSFITKRKPAKMKSRKRIPTLNVRPGLEVGAVVTIRKNKEELLNKLLAAVDNILKKKQISENNS